MLDKTGTITLGNRQAAAFVPLPGVDERDLADAAQAASLADETPEGRSIVILAKRYGLRERDLGSAGVRFVPFSAETRMSGIDLEGHELRKGAGDAIIAHVQGRSGVVPSELDSELERIALQGGTPPAVSRDETVLGVIDLRDVLKQGIQQRFAELRRMGVRTVMITGDNPRTAGAIAHEAGVDDFLAEATPERKLALIRQEQDQGRIVAMTGDGTNDAPALAQADVGLAMNTGTQAAREAGNMVDLDSDPTKLIEIVEVGKQLLITRGALTTFSIANDVAKYFAILPAVFAATYAAAGAAHGPLGRLNLMSLGSPRSAILSAIIYNALIIPALVPLALRGVRYRPLGASGLALPEPRDLRPRRPHRALHRDQADRPAPARTAGRLSTAMAKGQHKVFLGMAVGVGKTFRMLQEGHSAAAEGQDVAIGLLETHGRPETAALAEGLRAHPAQARPLSGNGDRGDGPAGDPGPLTAYLPHRRARPHQRARS